MANESNQPNDEHTARDEKTVDHIFRALQNGIEEDQIIVSLAGSLKQAIKAGYVPDEEIAEKLDLVELAANRNAIMINQARKMFPIRVNYDIL